MINWLIENGQLISRRVDDETGFTELVLRMPTANLARLDHKLQGRRSRRFD